MGKEDIMKKKFIVLFVSIVLMVGCGKIIVDYAYSTEYIFVNNTSHIITYMQIPNNVNSQEFEQYNIGPKSSINIKRTGEGAKNMQANNFMSPFGDNNAYKGLGLKLIVNFDGERCWILPFEGEHSPMDIKSYISEKIGHNNYKFTYTFTEEDYNRAVVCP